MSSFHTFRAAYAADYRSRKQLRSMPKAGQVDGDEDTLKEFDDIPPRLISSLGFWLWHGCCWSVYGLVTLIYIPWALAMHIILGALAVSVFFICCWRAGRQAFLYAYVITVMIPGKFLWFNLFIRNRRRARVWDFEMGKPRAIALQKRRRLSVSEATKSQPASHLLTKLSPEIRLNIYSQLIQGESEWLNVIEGEADPIKNNKRKRSFKPRAYPCILTSIDALDEIKGDVIRSLHRSIRTPSKENQLPSVLALLCTCRQIYIEGIDLLYSLPTFNFRELHRPPFFIRAALPHRLTCVRNIHLVYDQQLIKKMTHIGCSTARYSHQVGECTFCNPIHWINEIKKYMSGLKKIEIYMFLEKKQPLLTMGDTWIARMLDLQIGPNGLREMKIHVSPGDNDHVNPLSEAEYLKKAKRLDEQLQQSLKRGIERYAETQRAALATPALRSQLTVKPPPELHTKESQVIKAVNLNVP